MALKENLLAGFANSTWSALVNLVVIPIYLGYLGMEAYGLIGFFATTQALLQLLDMGIAPTLNREVARCSASGNLSQAGKLLHSLAVVYWSMGGAIAVLFAVLAPLIAHYWIHAVQLPYETIERSIMLMGFVIASRWPIGLYQSALIGAQRVTVLSAVSIVMVTLGSFGALAVIMFVSPTIEAFFIWQAGMGLVYTFGIRWAAWRIIEGRKEVRFDTSELRRVWRFSAGMCAIALSGLIFTQLDKLMLSKLIDLAEFGHYMLATAVVSGLQVLVMPAYNVIYPRFSGFVASGEISQLVIFYRSSTRVFAAVLFPVAMLIAVFADDFVAVWTGNESVATSVGPIISLLVIGSALNGVMFIPYALQLAYGQTWIPLALNFGLMLVLIPLIIFLAKVYGALGGAIAWSTLEAMYLILGPLLTHRYLLKGLALRWLSQDVGPPLGLSALVGVVGYWVIHTLVYSISVKLLWAVGLGMIVFLPMLWLSPQLRAALGDYVAWIRRDEISTA